MILLKPNVEVITERDIMKRIEICGRVCYNSEDKITEGSAYKFFNNIVKRGHTSVLEHSRLFVKTNTDKATKNLRYIITEYENLNGIPAMIRNCGSENVYANFDDNIWSGNLRAWRSIVQNYYGESILINIFSGNKLFADIQNMDKKMEEWDDPWYDAQLIPCDPLRRNAHEYITFKITCSRAVANEMVRHRLGSYSQSSTRYINYKDGVPFVEPWWYEDATDTDKAFYGKDLEDCQTQYINRFALENPHPQKSRGALNCDTACKLCMTGTLEYFKRYVLPLRTGKAAHPDIRIIANMISDYVDMYAFEKSTNKGE